MQSLRRAVVGGPRIAVAGVLAVVLTAVLPGCSCWRDPASSSQKPPETLEEMEKRRKELEEKKKEQKPDFETVRLTVLPSDDSPALNMVKPGHWFNAVQTSKANNFDFNRGELEARCVDGQGRRFALPGTNFDLATARPVSLPKGQQKHFDLLLYASAPSSAAASANDLFPNRRIQFETNLRPRGGGRELEVRREPTTTMKPYQNYLVVLADVPDNYQFVKALRSVKLNRQLSDMDLDGDELDYVVKLPKGTRRVDLPTHPLAWTNVAYVIWDDFNPAILSGAQQQAIVDWLHWGGQLIVSGPRTLDLLAGSEFMDYLPARVGETSTLSDDAIAVLNQAWTFPNAGRLRTGDSTRPLTIELKLTDDARYVPATAQLVAEKPVGRGRVVVTAFSLPHKVFLGWDSFDCFFNACLLARPARRFVRKSLEDSIVDVWSDRKLNRADPRLTSQVRYFSRDAMPGAGSLAMRLTDYAGRENDPESTAYRPPASRPYAAQSGLSNGNVQAEADPDSALGTDVAVAKDASPIDPPSALADGRLGFANDVVMGVAGWNDGSEASRSARESLEQSAGISVPSVRFIARVLGLYLLILVPLNWSLFRLLGRVEWAWAAVPVIAIAGALGVVRVAQLDIGFVRSRTEIAVVETQPDYDRGHATRYVGLYSSLSTRYQIGSENASTLIQPLASRQPGNDREVRLYQDQGVSLTGFSVLSNSTGMIHGEQMIELGGSISLVARGGKTSVSNQTDYDLQAAAVVRRDETGQLQTAWLGELAAKDEAPVEFEQPAGEAVDFPNWQASSVTRRQSVEGDLNIRGLLDLAADPARLGPGEAVLVGWNDALLPDFTVQPSASQVTVRTFFVAQLAHAARPPRERDENSYAVLLREKQSRRDDAAAANDFE